MHYPTHSSAHLKSVNGGPNDTTKVVSILENTLGGDGRSSNNDEYVMSKQECPERSTTNPSEVDECARRHRDKIHRTSMRNPGKIGKTGKKSIIQIAG